ETVRAREARGAARRALRHGARALVVLRVERDQARGEGGELVLLVPRLGSLDELLQGIGQEDVDVHARAPLDLVEREQRGVARRELVGAGAQELARRVRLARLGEEATALEEKRL